MVDLSATLAGLHLPTCVYNASGPRTGSSAAMAKIASSEAGGVLAKSATIASQTGNDQPRTWHEESGYASMNSEGLPNNGIDYYIDPKTIADTMGGSTKPYMVSISGHTLKDNLQMFQKITDAVKNKGAKIAAVELNLACPNVVGKPIIGYDFVQIEEVMNEVSLLPCFSPKPLFPLGLKLPPYFDRPHFEAVAAILNKYRHIVSYTASINTVGNALAIDHVAEMPAIRAKGGFAGLSGPAVKYTALANVRQMRGLLDKSIDIVGVGGINSGKDAFEMLLCGATVVQVGTCHWTEGPGCFDRICSELKDIMKEKGYTKIGDFRGKLKEWSKEGAAKSRELRIAKKKGESDPVDVRMSDGNQQMLIALLIALVAILLADKFGIVSL
mmetsp:Transcript_9841/g.19390  ORF Transcript_9841/g.19390 Transcript_9841/m.19390 type:complete len:385 (-) Transcript_9841:150-1304(-)